MHIDGTYTLLAPPERVWHGMRNQQILLRAVPGLREIEALDEHTFAISLTMDQEPFIGNCQGTLTISEQQFPYHYRIAIQGTNDLGQFRGKVSIHLQDRNHSTIVAYTGTVHLNLSGPPTSTTLARGATKLLIQQFFMALDDQLQAHEALDADFAAAIERYDIYRAAGTVGMKSKNGIILKRDTSNPTAAISPQSIQDSAEQGDIFSTIVHLTGLGQGQPEQEQMWTRRLRRASTIASLLFLVWLGTRLPRPRAKLECPPLTIHN
jgi:carbon monoxide dehydrogenase subunit G